MFASTNSVIFTDIRNVNNVDIFHKNRYNEIAVSAEE